MEIKIKISLLLKKCTEVVIYLMECDMLLHVLLAMHNFDFFFFFFKIGHGVPAAQEKGLSLKLKPDS